MHKRSESSAHQRVISVLAALAVVAVIGVGVGCQTYEEPVHHGLRVPPQTQTEPGMQPHPEDPMHQPQVQPPLESDW